MQEKVRQKQNGMGETLKERLEGRGVDQQAGLEIEQKLREGKKVWGGRDGQRVCERVREN